jgi:16S rRNA (adenine1518-N6/adenine1519-N6)-dimethyltransferase
MVKTFATKYKAEKLGQHLLTDETVLRKIVEAAQINKEDTILEIGPGTGNLTSLLLNKSKKVIAVEKDSDAVKYLRVFFPNKNFILYEDDILEFNIEKEIKDSYKVVANIPYYLTGKLIRSLLERKNKPNLIVILIQKEVAYRIIQESPDSNILSTSVQFYGNPKIIFEVSRKSFSPPPRVDSAVLKITNITDSKDINDKDFFKIVKLAFSSPRKKIINNISSSLGIEKNILINTLKGMGFSDGARAQELSVDSFKKLYFKIREINEG